MAKENSSEKSTAPKGGHTKASKAAVAIIPIAPPRITPMTPPTRQTSIASTMNWVRMSPWVAPSALRTPISRVRSVTVMSMMFITPMPPTSSEIPPMAESTVDMIRKTLVSSCREDDRSMTSASKSSLPL